MILNSIHPISCLMILTNDEPLQCLLEWYLQESTIPVILVPKFTEEFISLAQRPRMFAIINEKLPNRDAIALGRELRKISPMPILFLLDTVHQRHIRQEKIINSDFIIKPFDYEELFGHLQKIENLFRLNYS